MSDEQGSPSKPGTPASQDPNRDASGKFVPGNSLAWGEGRKPPKSPGRPKLVRTIIREKLAEARKATIGVDEQGRPATIERTTAEHIVEAQIVEAMDGNTQAFRAVVEYHEGKVPDRVVVEDAGEVEGLTDEQMSALLAELSGHVERGDDANGNP